MKMSNLVGGLQESYLRTSAGTMKTTPIEALEVALSVTLLDLRIMHIAKTIA